MYYYKKSEPGLYTVGTNNEKGQWESESDHESRDEAAKRVAFLNGGSNDSDMEEWRKEFNKWKSEKNQHEVKHYQVNGTYRIVIEKAASANKIDGFKIEANGDNMADVMNDAQSLYEYALAKVEATKPIQPAAPVK